jgi:hypothetical protein
VHPPALPDIERFRGFIMKVASCPNCGERQLRNKKQEKTTSKTIYKCRICGYEGSPVILEQYEGVFQGVRPAPGFIGPWDILVKLDNGERKLLTVLWEDARDCIKSLKLQRGDRVTVTVDEKIWCITKETDSSPEKDEIKKED